MKIAKLLELASDTIFERKRARGRIGSRARVSHHTKIAVSATPAAASSTIGADPQA
jgi:hypothetical protein